MVAVLKDLSPGAVARAIEWNLFGLYATFDRIPGARVDHEPHLMRVCTGLPHELLNGIFRAQFRTDDIDGSIDEAIEDFRSRELPMVWWTGPSSKPPELGKYLENMGLAHVGELTGTAVDLDTLPETIPASDELTIEVVRDEQTLMAWLGPVAFGYEFPEPVALALFDLFHGFGYDADAPFQHYLVRWKVHPVARCAFGADPSLDPSQDDISHLGERFPLRADWLERVSSALNHHEVRDLLQLRELRPQTVKIAERIAVPLHEQGGLDEVRPLRRVQDLGSEPRVKGISERDDPGDCRFGGSPGAYARTHRLASNEDLLRRQRLPCEPHGPAEVLFLPRQVPRRRPSRVDIPEIEAQRPDAL